jgi:hypothetical protein
MAEDHRAILHGDRIAHGFAADLAFSEEAMPLPASNSPAVIAVSAARSTQPRRTPAVRQQRPCRTRR